MNTIFPFGLPAVTAWYEMLLVVTLLVHLFFVSYVVLAVAVSAGAALVGRFESAIAHTLRDWSTFALSAAITAGIAPLLFVQILVQREFYTANLLLFHRWMAILPVLIVAFYAMYMVKAKRVAASRASQAALAIAVLGCVLFVGWSWVENHLLSLDVAAWPEQYRSESMVYRQGAILPRLLFWLALACPTGAALLAWQLRGGASGTSVADARAAARPLARIAVPALVAAPLLGWWSLVIGSLAEPLARGATSAAGLPWLVAAAIGAVVQVGGWATLHRARDLRRTPLAIVTAGAVAMWAGVLVVRECGRLSTLDLAALAERHARIGTSSGLVVFLVFAVLGVLAIAWIVVTVHRALRASSHARSGS